MNDTHRTSSTAPTSRKRRQKGRDTPPPGSQSAKPQREGQGKASPAAASGTDKWAQARRVMKTDRFRASALLAGFGLFLLAVSQSLPHDYGFTELGALFTFSVYDLVLAMLGIAVACAMMPSARQFAITIGVFLAVLSVMLLFFDPIFVAIRESALGQVLYLIAPVAVAITGASLWLSGRWRDRAMLASAAVVAFSFSLFLGLDDFGVGIPSFAIASVLSALWIILTPAFLLRCFKGPWLNIPSRILGSWLLVIAIIVTVSLYVPLPIKTQPPVDLGQPDLSIDGEDPGTAPSDPSALQDKGAYGSMNSNGTQVPDFLEEEPKPDPNAPSVFEGLKTPKIGG
ncbi:hypothetical protein GOZ89_21920 [Agrobacterium vitis]|uniref:hypothetical protein n=1 Tax=Agrobacterium vitis TaxID=373 RepID=UPI0012E8C82C|nr:hypothetical protein [Agrobacterium vitis]MVA82077.1 hypothetical protein [Agrobacterium vitis]